MKRRALWILGTMMILIASGLIYTAFRFNISAQQQPGKVETYLATKTKHWLVARAVAREGVSAEPIKDASSIARGQMLFDSCCSRCLGGGDSASGTLLGCNGPT